MSRSATVEFRRALRSISFSGIRIMKRAAAEVSSKTKRAKSTPTGWADMRAGDDSNILPAIKASVLSNREPIPTRQADSTLLFPDYPDLKPNMTPQG